MKRVKHKLESAEHLRLKCCVTDKGIADYFLTLCGLTYLSRSKDKARYTDDYKKVTCKHCRPSLKGKK